MPNATLARFGDPTTRIGEWGTWVVLLRPQQVTLGSLVLFCREPVTQFAAVSEPGFAALHGVVGRIERMLRNTVGFEKINYLMLMMQDPDVHFHVVPRYASPKTFEGMGFPDAGWPGVPVLGSFVEPPQATRDVLLARLRTAWTEAA